MDVRVSSLFYLSCVSSRLPTVCKSNSLTLILEGNRPDDLIREMEEDEEEEMNFRYISILLECTFAV
jgi:hypothetical protein